VSGLLVFLTSTALEMAMKAAKEKATAMATAV